MLLNKGVKLKFHALLRKQGKIYKFAKKRVFYPLTLVQGHLKIVLSYSAIQIRKSQEILEYYLTICNYFIFSLLHSPLQASEARPLRRTGLNCCRCSKKILYQREKFPLLLSDGGWYCHATTFCPTIFLPLLFIPFFFSNNFRSNFKEKKSC